MCLLFTFVLLYCFRFEYTSIFWRQSNALPSTSEQSKVKETKIEQSNAEQRKAKQDGVALMQCCNSQHGH